MLGYVPAAKTFEAKGAIDSDQMHLVEQRKYSKPDESLTLQNQPNKLGTPLPSALETLDSVSRLAFAFLPQTEKDHLFAMDVCSDGTARANGETSGWSTLSMNLP